MSVWDASGKQVDKQDAHVDLNDADHKTLIASVDPALAQTGLLTVKWHSVTPGDGGISDGSWQFVVGAASATPYPPTEVAQGGTPAAATPLAGATTTEVIAPATPQSSTPSPVSTPAGTPTPVAATGATGTGIWVLGAGVVVILAVIGLVLYARSS
jgi:hypothetical protein